MTTSTRRANALSFLSALTAVIAVSGVKEDEAQKNFLTALKSAKGDKENDYSPIIETYTAHFLGQEPSYETGMVLEEKRETLLASIGDDVVKETRAELAGDGVSTRRWNQIQQDLRAVKRTSLIGEVKETQKGAQRFYSL